MSVENIYDIYIHRILEKLTMNNQKCIFHPEGCNCLSGNPLYSLKNEETKVCSNVDQARAEIEERNQMLTESNIPEVNASPPNNQNSNVFIAIFIYYLFIKVLYFSVAMIVTVIIHELKPVCTFCRE